MANTVGKITGPLLESNLIRQGIDLAFETDLIYLDVNNRRVGINTDIPFRTLLVDGDISTSNLVIDSLFQIPNFDISNNTIENTYGDILLSTLGPSGKITATRLQAGQIEFDGLTISSIVSNADIELHTSGSGKIHVYNQLDVQGDLHATGNIIADGNIVFGDDDTDNVIFNADIGSNIVPNLTTTYSIGDPSKKFSNLYTYLINGTNVATGGAIVAGIDLSTRPGNTWYVSNNGNNSNVGDHPNGPFSTIEWALTQATSGDTVYIYPGTYVELFPLIIPEGVTVKGSGIRDVKIVPDTASTHEDVFKLNGQTTVEDLTIADFYYDSLNDKGYAFSFNTSFNVTSRSPYIKNISVITKGSVTSVGDPLGFNQGDAGRGAKIDGSVALSTSIEASLLFHSATFITPGVDCIVMKNGVRVEWLNSFIYFADKGLYALNGSEGFANQLSIAQVITGGTPGEAWAAPRTLSLAGTSNGKPIYSYGNEIIEWTGAYWKYWNSTIGSGAWYQSTEDTSYPWQASSWTAVGLLEPAPTFSSSVTLKFGAEVRSIGSANVYGNYGAYADGDEVLMYLITHNFGYIGSGGDTSNDPTNVIQANETIELNNGRIYYQSVDHKGDFRIGELLLIEQSTGRVVLDTIGINSTNLTVSYGLDTSYIDAYEVQTGNIQISGNTISSTVNGINFTSANGQINVASNLTFENFTQAQNFIANGITSIGNASTDTLTFNSRIATDLIPQNSLFNLGDYNLPFNELFAERMLFSDIIVDGNLITTTQSNSDLELRANGSGNIQINDTLTLGQNLSVSGIASLSTAAVSNTLTSNGPLIITSYSVAEYDNGQILIRDNFITTTESNSPLELKANNTGGIIFDQVLKVTDATISNSLTSGTESQRSVIFTPMPGKIVDISTNTAVKLPIGSLATRVLNNGEIRFNNTNSLFEGRITGGTTSLVGLYDIDKNTYITAELTPGANDNTIRMVVNGVVNSTIDSDRVQFNQLIVDELNFNSNVISTFNSNADIELQTSGSGVLEIHNNFVLDGGSLTNINSGVASSILSTGTGYVKFDGTGAIRIPYGTDSERQSGMPVGSTRYNTDQQYLEVWDGSAWVVATGGGPVVSAALMEDISDVWSLILG